MLTEALRKDIDSRWESCWPVNTLRPLVLIDGICYLLFFKKLEDHKLITRSDLSNNGKASYQTNSDEICWDNIKHLDPKNIYNLFYKENGIADLLKNYGHTNLPYSNFLKSPMLLNPSTVLLANIIEIIKIIESQDVAAKGNIFEYLLHKEEIHSARGQVYLPQDIVNAIVSIMRPAHNEKICDPACGNGDFLVSATSYISSKYFKKKSGLLSKKIIGLDNDPIQIRIAAMNMILHGIEDPLLLASDSYSGKADLIISNLVFDNLENSHADASQVSKENERKDISVLKNVLSNLKENGRAAVLIKNYLLNNNSLPEVKAIRQQIVDHYKIDAILHLPEIGSIPGASILIFHFQINEINDKIWFYKIKKQVNINGEMQASNNANGKNINESGARNTIEMKPAPDSFKYIKLPINESFCISVEEIRNSNYNLLYGQQLRNIAVSTPALTNGIAETKEQPASEILTKAKNIFDTLKKFDTIKAFIIPGKSDIVKRLRMIKRSEMIKRLEVIMKMNVSNKIDIFRRYDMFKRIHVGKKLDVIKRFDIRAKLNVIDSTDKFITAIAIPALILVLCITSLFFINRSKLHGKTLKAQTVKAVTTNKLKHPVKLFSDKKEKKKLTPQQIKAIIKDTSGIIHFENFSANNDSTDVQANVAEKTVDTRSHKKEKISLNESRRGIIKTKYTVADTTYFHDKPADGSARRSYLDPLKKNILTPLQESNGFIYIVYTNQHGRTSKGWIRKRDLRQLPE